MYNKIYALLTGMLLCATITQAQDCNLTKGTDDFSGLPKLSTGFMDLQDVKLNIDATGKEIDYFFVISNHAANCIGDQSEALVLFEGGKQKMTLRNTGGDNCNGYFHIVMKGGQFTPAALQKLSTKKVVSITFSDRNDKKTIIALTPAQQDLLLKVSGCVAEQAKTLPK